jgi:hypothetical protein
MRQARWTIRANPATFVARQKYQRTTDITISSEVELDHLRDRPRKSSSWITSADPCRFTQATTSRSAFGLRSIFRRTDCASISRRSSSIVKLRTFITHLPARPLATSTACAASPYPLQRLQGVKSHALGEPQRVDQARVTSAVPSTAAQKLTSFEVREDQEPACRP